MKSKIKPFYFLLLFAGLIISACPGFVCSFDTSTETKIAIETSLENRLTRVLKEITGTEKIVVIVNTEIYTEKEKKEIKFTKPLDDKKKMVLPGVPIKESIADRKIEDLLAPIDLGETRTMVKKISATIMMDKSVSNATIELVKKIAGGLIGLDAARGDQLVVDRIDFSKGKFSWETLIYPPNIFWIIGIFFGALFTIGAVLFLFNPFRNFARNFISTASSFVANQRERSAAETEGFGARGLEQLRNAETSADSGRKLAEGEEKKPFWFVDESSEAELIEFFKNEIPENIAVVLNYAGKGVASRLFAALPPEKQSNVAMRFAAVKQLNPSEVKSLEQKVKDRLDFSLKSESSLTTMLDYLDKQSQQKIISQIELKNSELARSLKESVFSFDDIVLFDDRTVQTLVRSINVPVFAQILKTMPENFKETVMNALPEGVKKIMRQEMELGRALPQRRIEEEKRRVVDTIRRMKGEGLVEMRAETVAKTAPAIPKPSAAPTPPTFKPGVATAPARPPFIPPKPGTAPAPSPFTVTKPASAPAPTIKPGIPPVPPKPGAGQPPKAGPVPGQPPPAAPKPIEKTQIVPPGDIRK